MHAWRVWVCRCRRPSSSAPLGAGVASARELDFQSLESLTRDYLELFRDLSGHHFPQDPHAQLQAAVAALFASWHSEQAVEYRRMNDIADDMGTAVTVQRMVFGNAGSTPGAGVAFTRDPASGENRLYLDFFFNAQGEDVASGRFGANDAERLALVLPQVFGQLQDVRRVLEQEFRDCQEFEFTVQDSQLYLLQTRSAKRTSWAALHIAVEQVCAGLIPPEAGFERLAGIDLERLQRRRLVCVEGAAALGRATPASLGVATGAIALDAAAVERLRQAGQPAILVCGEIATADIGAIAAAEGVLSVQGARTSHAAVVARQLGKACLVGCTSLRIDERDRSISIGERTLREGEVISLDGAGGQVFAANLRSPWSGRRRGCWGWKGGGRRPGSRLPAPSASGVIAEVRSSSAGSPGGSVEGRVAHAERMSNAKGHAVSGLTPHMAPYGEYGEAAGVPNRNAGGLKSCAPFQ